MASDPLSCFVHQIDDGHLAKVRRNCAVNKNVDTHRHALVADERNWPGDQNFDLGRGLAAERAARVAHAIALARLSAHSAHSASVAKLILQ